jgi:hypothetical protein
MTDSNHIYLNININYNDNPDHSCRYLNTSNSVLIHRPQDYYCAMARVYVALTNVPIMSQYPIQSGPTQTNPNLSTMSVTMVYGANTSPQTFCLWVQDDYSVPVPPPPSANPPTYQPIAGNYYFVYDYLTFMYTVNIALATAFAAIPGGPPGGSEAPYLQFENGLFSLVCQRAFYDLTLPTPIKIYFNSALHDYFIGIDQIKYSDISPIGEDYLINVVNLYNNWYNPSYVVPSTPPLYYIFTQQYSSLNVFNDLLGVSFESNRLPLRKEYAGANLSNGTVISKPVIADFNLIYTASELAVRSAIQYTATLYRLIDIIGDDPIQTIDMNVQFYNKNYKYFPIILDPSESCSMKLVFIKKDLYYKKIGERAE